MVYVAANDLEEKGWSLLDQLVKEDGEAIITEEGKNKYVIIPIDTYNRLREFELEAALVQTREDLKNGNVIEESVDDHILRIRNAI